MGKKVKQEDIARLAGVGVSTVSMILGGQGHRFSREVVKKVLEADRELSYTAGKSGLAEETGKDVLYCLYQSYIKDRLPPFYAELGFAIERSLGGSYRDLIIKTIAGFNELKSVVGNRADSLGGIILHGHFENVDLSFIPAEIPYVFLLPHFTSRKSVSIELDYQGGVYELVRHLKNLGHSSFAFLGKNKDSRHFSERQRGFLQALRELGLEEPVPSEKISDDIKSDEQFLELAEKFLSRWLKMKKHPTAIICSCSNFASLFIQKALEKKVSIPGEMSVAGFNNIPTINPSPLPLLALSIPINQIAEIAVGTLNYLGSQEKRLNHRIVIPCDKVFPGKSAGLVIGH